MISRSEKPPLRVIATDLKPCPHCGSGDIYDGPIQTTCRQCGASTETNEDWNRRIDHGQLLAAVRYLEDQSPLRRDATDENVRDAAERLMTQGFDYDTAVAALHGWMAGTS